MVNGKADIVLTIDDLVALPTSNYYQDQWPISTKMVALSGRTILVVASVNETVTGIVLSGNATVTCTQQKYKLEFLSFSPSNFKPGLLYTGFVS